MGGDTSIEGVMVDGTARTCNLQTLAKFSLCGTTDVRWRYLMVEAAFESFSTFFLILLAPPAGASRVRWTISPTKLAQKARSRASPVILLTWHRECICRVRVRCIHLHFTLSSDALSSVLVVSPRAKRCVALHPQLEWSESRAKLADPRTSRECTGLHAAAPS